MTGDFDRETICRVRSSPVQAFELHPCHRPGHWVGVTEQLYADLINALWLEGYHVSVVALDTGKLWVHVQEGLCGHEQCETEVFGE